MPPILPIQSAWERERRERGNPLTALLATWVKIHQQGEGQGEKEAGPRPSRSRGGGVRDTSRNSSSKDDSDVEENSAESAEMDSGDSDGEDIVEDFRLSSESDETD